MQRFSPILYPLLIGIYPVLTLFAHNIEEIQATAALRSLTLILLGTAILLLVLKLLLKNWQKAAFICTLALMLFFSYGHIYGYIKQLPITGAAIGRHRILGPLWLLIFVLGTYWITRSKRDLQMISQILNLVAVVVLVFPLFQIASFSFRTVSMSIIKPVLAREVASLHISEGKLPPDIYYIILDAYSRDDILKKVYQFDNAHFLQNLNEMGLYVASCSQSNYAQTQLSLASSLNFNYIQSLGDQFSGESKSRVGLMNLIKHNAVRQILENLGYSIIAFETGYSRTQIEDADVYLTPETNTLNLLRLSWGVNNFEVMLIKTSAGRILMDGAIILPKYIQPDLDYPNKVHRERVLYILEQLGDLPAISGPKFVFAHIISPHPPYVFGPDGEIVDREKNDIIAYRDQVTFMNSRIEPLLKKIISNSATPPIIIIQADHGGVDTPPNDRMAILNAYYLPDGGDQLLYEDISPVNSFRLIFDYYFGGSFGSVNDTSYFSVYQHPYEYTIIPTSRPGCIKK